MEFLLLAIAAIVWWNDRAAMRRRLSDLESALEHLRRQRSANETTPAAARPTPTQNTASRAETTPDRATEPVMRPAESAPLPSAPSPRPATASWNAPLATRAGSEPDVANQPAPASAGRVAQGRPSTITYEPAPGLFDRWPLSVVKEFFTGGNLVVRVGIVILFIGVAFLLRYAAEHTHVPIEWRLSGAALGAVVLLALGWRWRESRAGYALALQGGAVGILYLIVFAALRLYQLLTPGFAFALLAAVAALSAVLAVAQNSLAFALLGAGGGFLAPLLTSTGQGNHVALFSYYAVLDLAIVGIAWFRAWRVLNLTAFAFTYVIGVAWGVLRYRPEQLATTEPFLILFFLMFVTIPVLFALRRAPELKHYVDGTLVFAVPVVTMGLQTALVRHIPYALAYSAVALSAFYLLAAWLLRRWQRDTLRLLVESFIALGVAFATLAIPCALDGRWTAASWALEGTAVLWIGLRQQRRLAMVSGLLLQAAAGVAYLYNTSSWDAVAPTMLLANDHFVAALLLAVAGLISAQLVRRHSNEWLAPAAPVVATMLFGWALLWWLIAAFGELDRQVDYRYLPMSALVLLAGTAALSSFFGARVDWALPRRTALALVPVMVVAALLTLDRAHPFADGGAWAWPLAFIAAYALLRRDEQVVTPGVQSGLHALSLWLLVALASFELVYRVGLLVPESLAWSQASGGLLGAIALWHLAREVPTTRWPLRDHPAAYQVIGAAGLAIALLLWVCVMNMVADGSAAPLPYMPLLNPVELMQGLTLLALWFAGTRERALPVSGAGQGLRRLIVPLLALTSFAWLNAILLRYLHHSETIPYDLGALLPSTVVQTALTIFWTLLALAAMVWATRTARRIAWFAGAGLLAVVVAKLFLIDLSHTGTVPRIISFLGVGMLMLVVGYFSPLPPRQADAEAVA